MSRLAVLGAGSTFWLMCAAAHAGEQDLPPDKQMSVELIGNQKTLAKALESEKVREALGNRTFDISLVSAYEFDIDRALAACESCQVDPKPKPKPIPKPCISTVSSADAFKYDFRITEKELEELLKAPPQEMPTIEGKYYLRIEELDPKNADLLRQHLKETCEDCAVQVDPKPKPKPLPKPRC